MKQTKLVQLTTTIATTTTATTKAMATPSSLLSSWETTEAVDKNVDQNVILERKATIKSNEFCLKLDRKSSRGMIYENEELRLRTININAEVERGQSDIKRLKKENELLRREIWTLRDECDRLSKKVKAKFNERPRCSSCARGVYKNHKGYHCHCNGVMARNKYECNSNENCTDGTCNLRQNNCSNDDSNVCRGNCCYTDGVNVNEDISKDIEKQDQDKENVMTDVAALQSLSNGLIIDKDNGNHQESHKTKIFDHLSVVSEENLSNATEQMLGFTPDVCGSQTTLPSLVRPVTPLTPIDLIANELHDLQETGPPLSYFENILQQHMNNKADNSRECYNDTKKCAEQTNNWDYNLKSPFEQRYPAQVMPPVQTASNKIHNEFESETVCHVSRPILNYGINDQQSSEQFLYDNQRPIKNCTSATMTMANLTTADSHGNTDNLMPKHFFAPLKPQLRINTTLANQHKKSPSSFALTTIDYEKYRKKHKLEPPDIYVTNALATPWQCTKLRAQSLATIQQPYLDSSLAKSKNDSVNLDKLLSDIEAMSEDILSLQLEKINNRSKNIDDVGKTTQQFEQLNNKINNKPYKSEMNLFLRYDDDISIKGDHLNPLTMAKTIVPMGESNSGTSTLRRTRSWEGEQQQIDYSPPPNLPDPMLPFPNNRTYIGFDGVKKENHSQMQNTMIPITMTSVRTNQSKNDQITGLLPFATVQHDATAESTSTSILHNTKFKTTMRSVSVQNTATPPTSAALLNNVAVKRAIFRSTPTQRIESYDKQTELYDKLWATGDRDKINVSFDLSDDIKAIKQKEYRMSIQCDDVDNSLPEYPHVVLPLEATANIATTTTTTLTTATTTTGSCYNLSTVLPNQIVRHMKQISHSTPNSPHSVRKHDDEPSFLAQCNVMTIASSASSVIANSKQMANATDVGDSFLMQQQQQQQQQQKHYTNATMQTQTTPKSNKQDTMRAVAHDMICAATNVIHTKCLRRHSDGTIVHSPSNHQFTGSVSNGLGLTHTQPIYSHTHSHSHSHSQIRMHNYTPQQQQHQQQNQKLHFYRSHCQPNDGSSMTQFVHSNNQRQDSNHESVTLAHTERNNVSNDSNLSCKSSSSLTSSSTSSSLSTSGHSYSQRSQRRKVSINSQTVGKIPWCGCWGTGCL